MNDVIKQNPELVQNMMSAVQNTVPKSQQQSGETVDASGRREMQGPGLDISSLMGNIMMPPTPPMSTTSIPPNINAPGDDDVDDDISDIAEGDVANTRDEKDDGDNEVREVKVTQTKSKRGGGKKKKSVEINL